MTVASARPRKRSVAALSVLAAAAALAAAPSAGAHELDLVLVAPPPASASAGDAADGFRLAVDQSPDVSHAPGEEAGDHLGGIDVATTLVQSRSAPGNAARRVARADVVVVLPPVPMVSELLPLVRDSRRLIVVAGTRGTLPASPETPVVLLRPRRPAAARRTRLERFERQFAARFGRGATAAALVGYDAGRLLDGLLAALGEGPFTEQAIASALPGAASRLVAGAAGLARAVPARRSTPSDAGSSARGVPLVLGAAAAAGLVAAAFVLLARRRRTR